MVVFFIIFNEIDMFFFMEFWKFYKDGVLKNEGVKFGFMFVFVKVVCFVFKEILVVNVSIEGDFIVYRDYVDLFVVVVIFKGLVIFIVRNVESMGFVEIEKVIVDLGKKVCLMEWNCINKILSFYLF